MNPIETKTVNCRSTSGTLGSTFYVGITAGLSEGSVSYDVMINDLDDYSSFIRPQAQYLIGLEREELQFLGACIKVILNDEESVMMGTKGYVPDGDDDDDEDSIFDDEDEEDEDDYDDDEDGDIYSLVRADKYEGFNVTLVDEGPQDAHPSKPNVSLADTLHVNIAPQEFARLKPYAFCTSITSKVYVGIDLCGSDPALLTPGTIFRFFSDSPNWWKVWSFPFKNPTGGPDVGVWVSPETK